MDGDAVDEHTAPTLDELISAWALLSGATVDLSLRLAEGLDASAGLSLPAFDVLVRLLRAAGQRLPVATVAADVGLTAGGFTKLLDRLELDGLVVRERNPADRRTDEVSLTSHGREVASSALTRYAGDLREHLAEPLGPGRLGDLVSLTRALREHHRSA